MNKIQKKQKTFNNYMQIAIDIAKKQNKNIDRDKHEIPIGCVIVDNTTGKIVAKSSNKTISKNNPTFHSEIICINNALKKLKTNRLENCSMYVTLEPCCMCAGAIILAKIGKIYIGCMSEKTGCGINNYSHFTSKISNYKPEVFYPIMEDECKQLIKDFFKVF